MSKPASEDYNRLRGILFRERDENNRRERELKSHLQAAENRLVDMTHIIAEYQAGEAMAHQRFNQMQAELEKAQANITGLSRTDRANVLRLINNALEKFDDDPDGAFANLNRAKTTLTQGGTNA